MHTYRIFALVLGLAFIAPHPAEAAKKNRKGKQGSPAVMLGRFDRDGSGTLEQQEAERARQMFGALKKLDADSNGELSDSELASVKVEKPKRKGGKGGKGKKGKKDSAGQ